MKNGFLLLGLLTCTLTAQAATFSSYYPSDFEGKVVRKELRNEELKNTLFEIASYGHQTSENGNDVLVSKCATTDNCFIHKSLGYSTARKNLFGLLDLKQDDRGYFLTDVYCEQDFVRTDIGPLKIPDNNIINCEHTWPQSKFTAGFPNEMQKSDLHHLYVTSSKANSARGNNPFGEVTGKPPAANCDASVIGKEMDPDTNQMTTLFTPPPAHRGNVARALFYFSVRYRMAIDRTQEAALKQWHKEDPVTDEDIKRNDQIKDLQGNRNPFVDYPELVDLIDNF